MQEIGRRAEEAYGLNCRQVTDGLLAREKLDGILAELGKYATPEEIKQFLDDMTTSYLYTRGSDNIFNQVQSFVNLFSDDDEGSEFRAPQMI